jgi:hypothetical protein
MSTSPRISLSPSPTLARVLGALSLTAVSYLVLTAPGQVLAALLAFRLVSTGCPC